jgi:hypothetical protein
MAARVSVLVFYAAALASFFIEFPPLLDAVLQYGTLALLVAHTLEVVFCFRWVRLYPGPVLVSVCLTLLFGFVHWMPYKKRAEAGAAG